MMLRALSHGATTLFIVLGGGCSSDGPEQPLIPDCDVDCPQLLLELGSDFGNAMPAADFAPLRVGLFVSVTEDSPATAWTRDDAFQYMTKLVADTDSILAQCKIYLDVEVANVISLPEALMDIKGNEPGSFGGHPPADVTDPELFNYEQNATLTDETRKLFEYAKGFTSKNSIAAITVRDIEYYAEGETINRGAGGLSFPPNNFHSAPDYPARNSVLLVPSYNAAGELPNTVASGTLAQELGHMLLNVGGHVPEITNLMNGTGRGTDLTSEQCSIMQSELSRLFGDGEVPDPGPPS